MARTRSTLLLAIFPIAAALLMWGCAAHDGAGRFSDPACGSAVTKIYFSASDRSGSLLDVFCGEKTTAADVIAIPFWGPQFGLDHDVDGHIYMLQTDPNSELNNVDYSTGFVYKYDGGWAKSDLIRNVPRAMIVDRDRGRAFVLSLPGTALAPAQISVFDTHTLEWQFTYAVAGLYQRKVLATDAYGDLAVALDEGPIVILDPLTGHIKHRLTPRFSACAMYSGGVKAFYMVDCLGTLSTYDPLTFREIERTKHENGISIDGFLHHTTMAVDSRGNFYLVNAHTNQLLMYHRGQSIPFKTIESTPILSIQLDRNDNLYAFVAEPQLSNVTSRLDVYRGGTGTLERTYTFPPGNYPFAMTVVSTASAKAPR